MAYKEITEHEYETADKIAHEINWYIKVEYYNSSPLYFVADELYDLKLTDFFDDSPNSANTKRIIIN